MKLGLTTVSCGMYSDRVVDIAYLPISDNDETTNADKTAPKCSQRRLGL